MKKGSVGSPWAMRVSGSEVDADLGEQGPVFELDVVAFVSVQVAQVEAGVVHAFAVVGADDGAVAEQVFVLVAVVGHDHGEDGAGADGEAAADGQGVARREFEGGGFDAGFIDMVDLDVGANAFFRGLDQAAVHVEVEAVDEHGVVAGAGGVHHPERNGQAGFELEAGLQAGEEGQAVGLGGGGAEREAGDEQGGCERAECHGLS